MAVSATIAANMRRCSSTLLLLPSSSFSSSSSRRHRFSAIASILYKSSHKGPTAADMKTFLEKLRASGGHDGVVELTRSDRDDRVLELTLKHTKNRNSLTGKMMATLHDLSLELTKPTGGQYQDCCALILRGEGTSFCAGADFHLASSILTPEEGVMMAEVMTSTLTRLRRTPLITVAALGGPAMGGGAELATTTDFRVMSRTQSKIQFVQTRMGVSCGWGGTSRLVKLVGRQKALLLLGTATPIDAPTAKDMGLVDLICDEDGEDIHQATWKFLMPFLRHTTESLRAIKLGVAGADDLIWDKAREVETEAFKSTWGSPANIHALTTAKEKIAADKKKGGGKKK